MKKTLFNVAALSFFISCGNPQSYEPLKEQKQGQTVVASKWKKVKDYLGLKNKQTTPLEFKQDNPNHKKLKERLEKEWLGQDFTGELVSFEEFGTKNQQENSIFYRYPQTEGSNKKPEELEAKLWLVSYRKKPCAENDTFIHHALVSIPNQSTETKKPIIFFAHGNDQGISSKNLASSVGENQNTHVIVAPAFPGEPVLKESSLNLTWKYKNENIYQDKKSGESLPWVNDSDDLLLIAKVLDDVFTKDDSVKNEVEQNLTQHLNDKVLFNEDGMLNKQLFGTSRGGLSASLAVAKTGLFNQKGRKNDVPQFSKLTILSSPTTTTAGNFLETLEFVIKGESSLYDMLPCTKRLKEVFQDFRDKKGDDLTELEDACFEIARRDLAFSSPYLKEAFHFSGEKEKNIYFLFHTQDKIIKAENKEFFEYLTNDFKNIVKIVSFGDEDSKNLKFEFHLTKKFWSESLTTDMDGEKSPANILSEIFNS